MMEKGLRIGIIIAVILFCAFVLLGVILWQIGVFSPGSELDDFTEGTEIRIELRGSDDVNIANAVTKRVLEGRLKDLGINSAVISEADKRYIKILVATTDPTKLEMVRDIINPQAVFEQYVGGGLCAKGEEIQLDTNQAGATMISGKKWEVFVRISGDAPVRCGLAMKGKAGHMTDIFLDRPNDAIILLDNEVCEELSSAEFTNNMEDVGYTQLSFIEERANIPIVCYGGGMPIEEELGIEFVDNESDNGTKTPVQEIRELWETKNKTNVILMTDQGNLPEEIQGVIEELGLSVTVVPKYPEQPYHDMYNSNSWIDGVTGLKSTLVIQEGLTYGSPIFNSVFTETATSEKEAKEIVEEYEIWLTSGSLPTKIAIISERQINF